MTTRSLTASLKGFGAPPAPAAIVVEHLTPRRRLAPAGLRAAFPRKRGK